jgi:hypothetical protein
MNITLKINEHPPLKKCEMTVDGCLHQKLEKYPVLSYLNQHSTNLLIGKPRSGKSSLLYSLFSSKHALKKLYHKVYTFIPASSRTSFKKDIFSELPDNQQYFELSYENLESVFEEIKSLPKEENKCIIFDDMSAYLKQSELQTLFKEICFNRRHHSISVYFLCQTFFSIPKELRRIFTNLFIFKVPKNVMETIFSELLEQKENIILPIMKMVYDEPFNFLFVNLDSQKMFKNWDEIVIEE